MQRFCGMLGFAKRAGKTVVGFDLICSAMPRGTVKLVVISASASAATKKRLTVKSEFYGIESIEVAIDTARLGNLIGKSALTAAVAVTDEGLAEEIKKAAVSE